MSRFTFWSVLSLRLAGERDYHLLALTQPGLIQSRGDSKQFPRPMDGLLLQKGRGKWGQERLTTKVNGSRSTES